MSAPLTVHDPDTMTPRARKGSPQTSVLATIEATPKAPAMTDRIWVHSAEWVFTPEDMTARLQAENDADGGGRVLLTSVRARINGLKKAGRLIDSGERGLGESNKSKAVRLRRTTPAEMSAVLASEAAKKAAKEAGA